VQIRRVGDTIRRIREFAKKKTPEQSLEDINRIVEEAAAIAAVGTKGKGIRTAYDLAAALPPVWVDRIQIQQVVMNLARNSIDAMENSSQRDLTLCTRLVGAGLVEVNIIDTGPGIPPADVERLFMPFMSTKSDGTGLGLAICKSIVEAHDGKLLYLPNPEGGAIFRFNVPVAAAKGAEA
jgi:signal transduction histidine kinase